MKSSSLKMLEGGIADPKDYRDSVIHDWNLKQEYQDKLIMYIIRETTPQELFFNITDGELKIKGKMFSIVWCDSPAKAREGNHLLISLRFCKFLERGYALVKILRGDRQFDKLEY